MFSDYPLFSATTQDIDVTSIVACGKRSSCLVLSSWFEESLRSCVMTKDESLSCCIGDEGRPLGFGHQRLGSNRPMRQLLRVLVVSDREKAERICQVCSEEMNANEPLMRCRYDINAVKTGERVHLRDEFRRNLSTGEMAAGMEVA